MFEKVIPPNRDSGGPAHGNESFGDLMIGKGADMRSRGGALRAVEWAELTARLNAVRDLRQLMQRDSRLIMGKAASFGDAAASYFSALDYEERVVNPDALEACKASDRNGQTIDDDAAESDARDY